MPHVIGSERLDLVALPADLLDSLVAGRREEASSSLDAAVPDDWPDEHDGRFLALRRDQLRKAHDPELERWLVRAIVLRDERHMIGHVGFHGRPGANARRDPRAVEIGYTIFPPWRGHGYATEAARALMGWAATNGIRRFLASVAPTNEPSLRIVARLGFGRVGEHWDDEDGAELEFERVL